MDTLHELVPGDAGGSVIYGSKSKAGVIINAPQNRISR